MRSRIMQYGFPLKTTLQPKIRMKRIITMSREIPQYFGEGELIIIDQKQWVIKHYPQITDGSKSVGNRIYSVGKNLYYPLILIRR